MVAIAEDQKIAIIRKIAERIRSPEKMKAVVLDPKNHNPDPFITEFGPWGGISLSAGYAGTLLFLACLNGADEVIHQYVVKIRDELESGWGQSLSMYGGLAGVCFSILCVSHGRNRYGRLLETMEGYLIEQVKERYFVPMRKRLEEGLPIYPLEYDLIQGIVGIGLYGLLCLDQERFVDFSKEIAVLLTQITQPLNVEGHLVPGWYQPKEMQFLEKEKIQYPKGSFNMGLAHGVPGILGFLALAIREGVCVPGQKEAIVSIVEWIQKRSVMTSQGLYFPHRVSWEEELSGKINSSSFGRDVWCYGAAGVTRPLYLAGEILQREDWKAFALQGFSDIFKRKSEQWGAPSPTMCHGLSGLALITHLMAKDTHDPFLKERAQDLEKQLWTFYNEDYPFGFKDLEPKKSGGIVEMDKAGLLEGAFGVLATLLSFQTETLPWYYPFLLI